ncbi:hypothetical protein Nepgr_026472 [Nepenthes gracilis]|uniref:Transcription repressor n=1 Tax=Nepenthes gracilis TaxID=150966 RepID=A0AAD3Y240_NEPGR|nr:hypothetical protein Nepgr_026472 [Nepenthes gracilis]
MPERFKFRLPRVIPTFQSCRSKEPSALPANPVPPFFRPSSLTRKLPNLADPLPSRTFHSAKRRVLPAAVSAGCGFRSRCSSNSFSATDRTGSPDHFKWRKEDEWHVVAKICDDGRRRKVYNSAASADSDSNMMHPPPLPPPLQKRRSRRKKTTVRLRLSTSSADSGLFSSEGREERKNGKRTETLVSSSRGFSTDSSAEYNPHLETIRDGPAGTRRKKKPTTVKRTAAKLLLKRSNGGRSPSESVTPLRLSVLQRLIPRTIDGKLRESFAVLKKSNDPYEDFRRSIMEMILDKQMFEEKDLMQLLSCFLSLNSRRHHEAIVEAFTEIWIALFCNSPTESAMP